MLDHAERGVAAFVGLDPSDFEAATFADANAGSTAVGIWRQRIFRCPYSITLQWPMTLCHLL